MSYPPRNPNLPLDEKLSKKIFQKTPGWVLALMRATYEGWNRMKADNISQNASIRRLNGDYEVFYRYNQKTTFSKGNETDTNTNTQQPIF